MQTRHLRRTSRYRRARATPFLIAVRILSIAHLSGTLPPPVTTATLRKLDCYTAHSLGSVRGLGCAPGFRPVPAVRSAAVLIRASFVIWRRPATRTCVIIDRAPVEA